MKRNSTMFAAFKNFAANESGAVTVDWVVLTAAIVGLGLAVMAVVSGGIEDLSDDINDGLAGLALEDEFTAGEGLTIDLGTAD
jgi:Flp pilus assembly pilin Flp